MQLNIAGQPFWHEGNDSDNEKPLDTTTNHDDDDDYDEFDADDD